MLKKYSVHSCGGSASAGSSKVTTTVYRLRRFLTDLGGIRNKACVSLVVVICLCDSPGGIPSLRSAETSVGKKWETSAIPRDVYPPDIKTHNPSPPPESQSFPVYVSIPQWDYLILEGVGDFNIWVFALILRDHVVSIESFLLW